MLGRSAFSPMALIRIVATPAAIDALAAGSGDRVCIRIAPDEILIDPSGNELGPIDDPHAIAASDHSYSVAVVRSEDELARAIEWEWPATTPVGQGLLLAVPVKLVRHRHLLLLFCPTAVVHELEERLG